MKSGQGAVQLFPFLKRTEGHLATEIAYWMRVFESVSIPQADGRAFSHGVKVAGMMVALEVSIPQADGRAFSQGYYTNYLSTQVYVSIPQADGRAFSHN